MTAGPSPSAQVDVAIAAQELSAGWHLRMIAQLARKTVVGAFIGDLFMAGVLLRKGWWWPPVAWLVLSTAAKLARAVWVHRIVQRGTVPVSDLVPGLAAWFLLVGVTQSGSLVLARLSDDREGLMMVSMIMMAMAGAGVGTSAGIMKAYVAWAVPFTAAISWAWLTQPLLMDRLFGGLVLVLPLMLVLYARDYSRVLDRQQLLLDSLRIERDRAESAIAAKRAFFAAASHDLRQPLGVIRWYGDAVQAHAHKLSHAALLSAGKGIARAVEHAEPLVRRYLEIAQFEAGAVKVDIRTIDARRLLEQVREAFVHEAANLGLLLNLDLPGSAADPPWLVRSDGGMLRSILDNVVGNALKFTPQGQVSLALARVETEQGPRVRITVQDTGVGISADDQRRIFDDFYQVANQERIRSRGVGLGLAIARRQMQLLGIQCALHSSLGSGTTLELDLPPALPPFDQLEARAGDDALPVTGTALQVLVVDDEPDVREALACMLQAGGWQAYPVSGVAEALLVLRQGFQPDALIIDFRLQGDETGADCLRELRAAGCAAPAVFVTGDTSAQRLTAIAAVKIPYLHKPVDGPMLMRVIAALVDERRQLTA